MCRQPLQNKRPPLLTAFFDHPWIRLTLPVVVAGIPLLLARPTAIGATLRLIGKALFLIESLLTFGEHEFGSAIPANDLLVWHVLMPP
jgi:hypothetical protein